MDSILEIAGHNFASALLLGILVWGVTRIWRNPPVAHVLWVIVMVRLISPPVFEIGWNPGLSFFKGTMQTEGSHPQQSGQDRVTRSVGILDPGQGKVFAVGNIPEPFPKDSRGVVARWGAGWKLICSEVFWVWICGAGVILLVSVARIISFQVRIRGMMPAGERQQGLLSDVASRMGMRRVPQLKINERDSVPLVVCLGRRGTILVSRTMLENLSSEELEPILAHELAHIKRRDHWVRLIELIVAVVWWWNPLVKLVRNELHRAEEESCDAWVTSLYPQRLKEYAEILFQSACRVGGDVHPVSALASPFFRENELKARIKMILKGSQPYRMSRMTGIATFAAGLLLVTLFLRVSEAENKRLIQREVSGESATDESEKEVVATEKEPAGEKDSDPPKIEKNSLGMLLKYGDGKADGKKSLGGTGEMILFEMPEGITEVKGLKIHGSRYGYPQPPNEDFEITFVTEDFSEILTTEAAPYSLFQRGESKWVNVKFKSPVTDLPKKFWVVLNFHAQQTKGIYLSYDTSTKGAYSRMGLAGDPKPRNVEFGGDWMIQIQTGKK